jgi:hypothetical protein
MAGSRKRRDRLGLLGLRCFGFRMGVPSVNNSAEIAARPIGSSHKPTHAPQEMPYEGCGFASWGRCRTAGSQSYAGIERRAALLDLDASVVEEAHQAIPMMQAIIDRISEW